MTQSVGQSVSKPVGQSYSKRTSHCFGHLVNRSPSQSVVLPESQSISQQVTGVSGIYSVSLSVQENHSFVTGCQQVVSYLI